MLIKLGADPEFFLQGKYNKNISAHNLVKGTKSDPFPLNKGALQADGTAVEFNIDAASTPEEFALNIQTVLTQVREIVPKEYEFKFTPTIQYGREYFRESIPKTAKELGCDPDFDAWDLGSVNPRPEPLEGFRTGSGHLHIGWTEGADPKDPDHLDDCMSIVRRLDYYFKPIAGIWETPADQARRRLYGNWGAFRPKSYGVEYRVLGNSWLKHPKLWPWMFRYVNHAVDSLANGVGDDDLYVKPRLNAETGKLDRAASLPPGYYGSYLYGMYTPRTSPGIFESHIQGAIRPLPPGAPLPRVDMLESE